MERFNVDYLLLNSDIILNENVFLNVTNCITNSTAKIILTEDFLENPGILSLKSCLNHSLPLVVKTNSCGKKSVKINGEEFIFYDPRMIFAFLVLLFLESNQPVLVLEIVLPIAVIVLLLGVFILVVFKCSTVQEVVLPYKDRKKLQVSS